MIRSMTGFGSAEGDIDGRKLSVDLKAVNHRYFNFFSKLPQNIQTFENRIQALIKSRLTRGQVNVFATWDKKNGSGAPVHLNMQAAGKAKELLEEMKSELSLSGEVEISHILEFSAVVGATDNGLSGDEGWKALEPIFEKALAEMEAFRVREGEDLKRDLIERLDGFAAQAEAVGERAPEIVADYKARLKKRIEEHCAEEVSSDAVAERVGLEVALFADRCDISEEMVRLRSHIDKFREILDDGGVVGRKIDFLIQEMNRETNTVGSKAPDAATSGVVVEMKSELEKIREQVQNIE